MNYKLVFSGFLFFLIASFVSLSSPVKAIDQKGWVVVSPGGNTICGNGSPYSFYWHPGTSGKLVVDFGFGVSCNDAVSCKPGGGVTDHIDPNNAPWNLGGAYDFTNPSNPLKDDAWVRAGYCTADLAIGSKTVVYQNAAQHIAPYTFHHNGFVNAASAMNFAYQQFATPSSVFVTGCSGGGGSSIWWLPYIAQNYSGIPINHFDDSNAWQTPNARPQDIDINWGGNANLPSFVPGVSSLTGTNFSAAPFFIDIANYLPNSYLSQFDYQSDHTQINFFQHEGGTAAGWTSQMETALANITAGAPNFRYMLASGTDHCVLPKPTFYTTSVNGMTVRDFVNGIYTHDQSLQSVSVPF